MKRVAVVTGGTRGIGAAICKALQADTTVVATFASDTQSACDFGAATGMTCLQWDVGDPQSCRDGLKRIEDEVGAVDILVNNAGITRDVPMHRMSWDDWEIVIRTNLGGCFNMARVCYPAMRERGWGRIVNIGSVNGQTGQVGQVNYSAAKSGIDGLTRSLAREGAKYGVTVNTIAPGYIDTEMVAQIPEAVMPKILGRIAVGRLGEAEEIARAVRFLVSEEAGYVTGATLSINGGMDMR